MRNLVPKILLGTISFLIGITVCAQDGYFVDISYKAGSTSMSYAYATYLPVNSTNTTRVFELHKDGFYQTNFRFDIGRNSENVYWKANLDGLFFLIYEWVADEENSNGPLKSKFRKYDELKEANPLIAENEPTPYYREMLHPVSGGGDYKFVDWDLAFGGEVIKIGLNYSFGMLGANYHGNGLTFYDGINGLYAGSFGVGYHSFGLKGFLFNTEELPIKAQFGINRLSSIEAINSFKRKGWGIDLEAKYVLLDGVFKPYVSVYFEYKRFNEGKEPSKLYVGSTQNSYVKIDMPALKATSFGISIGVLLSDEY